ncbi:MAG: NfeD family protein [Dermatophilaceae bacterium]
MDWLSGQSWLAWLGLALVLAAIEAVTVDFVFLMFAGGALAGAVAAGAGAPLPVQVVVAVVAACLLLAVVRPVVRRKFTNGEASHHIGAAGLVGREARVLQAVTDTDGRVKLGGEVWSARLASDGEPVNPGDSVRVVAINGATALVTPIPAPDSAP